MAELAARHQEFEKVCEAKCLEKYSTYLCSDVEMWGPEGQPIRGKPAVLAEFQQMMPTLDFSAVSNLKVEEFGEFGFITFTTRIQGENYKDMMIWRKVGGAWLLFRDVYSSC